MIKIANKAPTFGRILVHRLRNCFTVSSAFYSSKTEKGLVLGVCCTNPVHGCSTEEIGFTPSAKQFDEATCGKLGALIKNLGIAEREVKIFNDLHPEYCVVAVVGLPRTEVLYCEIENVIISKHISRCSSGMGTIVLLNRGCHYIYVDSFIDIEAAAEGACLGQWNYNSIHHEVENAIITLYQEKPDSTQLEQWERGCIKACAQNVARYLSISPGSYFTPSHFAQTCQEILSPLGIQVIIRDVQWMKDKCMSGFLKITEDACQPPYLLELHYRGGPSDQQPIVLTGKGATFEPTYQCMAPCKDIMLQNGDKGGASVVVGVFQAIAKFKYNINVTGLIPLYENVPGAIVKGEVIQTLCRKTVGINSEIHDGRIVMADVLTYSQCFKPSLVINCGTMKKGTKTPLSASTAMGFSTCSKLWEELFLASAEAGDRVWRFPFWEYFRSQTEGWKVHPPSDLVNVPSVYTCSVSYCAAFLKEFVQAPNFIHLDLTGALIKDQHFPAMHDPFLRCGLTTGKITRTLIQFLCQKSHTENNRHD